MVIGITGGIGSGKSTVANKIAEITGAYLILTDDVAKNLMEPGNQSYVNVVNNFGEDILLNDRSIDRQKLAEIVFNDKDKLELLNKCTHPAVIERTKQLINKYKNSDRLIIIESALLKESGINAICDKVWYVYSDINVRKHRLKNDRGYSESRIEEVIKKQNHPMYYNDINEKYDKIIINNGNMEQLNSDIRKVISNEFGI